MVLCISLFELGLQPQLANLYPPVQYPVSRGTPIISPLVRWEHSEDQYVMKYLAEVTLQFSFENYLTYLNKLNVSSLQRPVTWNCSDKYFLLILGNHSKHMCSICMVYWYWMPKLMPYFKWLKYSTPIQIHSCFMDSEDTLSMICNISVICLQRNLCLFLLRILDQAWWGCSYWATCCCWYSIKLLMQTFDVRKCLLIFFLVKQG